MYGNLVNSSATDLITLTTPVTDAQNSTTSNLYIAEPSAYDLSADSQRTDVFNDTLTIPAPYITSEIPTVFDFYYSQGNISTQLYFDDLDRTVFIHVLETEGDTSEFIAGWFSYTNSISSGYTTFYVDPQSSALTASSTA